MKRSLLIAAALLTGMIVALPAPGVKAFSTAEELGPEAAEMKRRHFEEWQDLMSRQREERAAATGSDRAALNERHAEEKRTMKARHKAEWDALVKDARTD